MIGGQDTKNRSISFFVWSILPLFLVLLPSFAFALAGFAEKSSVFHYNDFTDIFRGHPSDMCPGATQWCLDFERKEARWFKGINSTFEKINVPPDRKTPFIIGQLSSDSNWLVYDLGKEKILISHPDYEKAIHVWNSLGMKEPIYVTPHNTRDLLTETEESSRSNWRTDLMVWAYLTLVPGMVVMSFFWYLSKKLKERYKETSSKHILVFSYLFLIPVFFLLYIVTSSLIYIIWQNW